jgi:hypothetical protein
MRSKVLRILMGNLFGDPEVQLQPKGPVETVLRGR